MIFKLKYSTIHGPRKLRGDRSEDFGMRISDFGLTESKRCAGLSGKRVNRQITILPQGDVNCLWISGGLRSN